TRKKIMRGNSLHQKGTSGREDILSMVHFTTLVGLLSSITLQTAECRSHATRCPSSFVEVISILPPGHRVVSEFPPAKKGGVNKLPNKLWRSYQSHKGMREHK